MAVSGERPGRAAAGGGLEDTRAGWVHPEPVGRVEGRGPCQRRAGLRRVERKGGGGSK